MKMTRVHKLLSLMGFIALALFSGPVNADLVLELTEGAGDSVILSVSGDGILQFGSNGTSANGDLVRTTGFLVIEDDGVGPDDFDVGALALSGLYTVTRFSVTAESNVDELSGNDVLFTGFALSDVVTTTGTSGFQMGNWQANGAGLPRFEVFTDGHDNDWDGNSDFIFDTTFSASSIIGNYSDLTEGTYNFRTGGIAGKNLITFQIGTPIPEPASFTLLSLVTGVIVSRRKR